MGYELLDPRIVLPYRPGSLALEHYPYPTRTGRRPVRVLERFGLLRAELAGAI